MNVDGPGDYQCKITLTYTSVGPYIQIPKNFVGTKTVDQSELDPSSKW